MRILGLAVVVFLIAAALLAARYSDEIVLNVADFLPAETQLTFELDTPESGPTSSTHRFVATGRDTPALLSGFGSYQSMQFLLPTDSRAVSGHLELDLTIQAHDEAVGTLRVQVNGERRAELLIPADGIFHRTLTLPLTLEDLAAPTLTTSFSLQGEVGSGVCRLRDQAGAVVEVEQTSGLVLDLDKPLRTVRDRLASWGGVARMGWTGDTDEQARVQRISAMARLLSLGQPARLEDSSNQSLLTLEEIEQLADRLSRSERDTWPVDLSTQPSNSGLRRFSDTTLWRYRYQLNGETSPPVPTDLDYALYLGPTMDNDDWIIVVTLNDRILGLQTYPSGPRQISGHVPLPADYHLDQNLLQIEARTTGRNDDGSNCEEDPFLMAELLTGSMVSGDGGSFESGLNNLRALVAGRAAVVQPTHLAQLSAVDAQHAAQLLSALSPTLGARDDNGQGIEFTVIPAGRDIPRLEANKTYWMIGHDSLGEPVAERLVSQTSTLSGAVLRLFVYIPHTDETSTEEMSE